MDWNDILRVVVSISTGEVRAYDVVRMLQRDGHPTALGEAIAMYGRIPKTLHICSLAAEEAYRRDIKGSATSRRAAMPVFNCRVFSWPTRPTARPSCAGC